LHVATNNDSQLPTIGASGAIAAVMGAYFRFFPGARIDAVVPPFVFGPVIMLPAVLFLGLWFLLQFFQGAAALGAATGRAGGIAWWAHIGGFAFGLLVCLAAGRPHGRARGWED
jgi:membrane associated rhomboid family serine protease